MNPVIVLCASVGVQRVRAKSAVVVSQKRVNIFVVTVSIKTLPKSLLSLA